MTSVAVARHAMATRFEIVLHGENEVGLRAAAEEAQAEIQRCLRSAEQALLAEAPSPA